MKTFDSLKPRQKKGMQDVLEAWKKTGLSTKILEEGLALLSSGKRPKADALVRDGSPFMDFACTYGKRYNLRHALSIDEAEYLRGVVAEIRALSTGEENARKLIDMSRGILFGDQKLPSTITDPSWEPVLKVISDHAPGLRQHTLF